MAATMSTNEMAMAHSGVVPAMMAWQWMIQSPLGNDESLSPAQLFTLQSLAQSAAIQKSPKRPRAMVQVGAASITSTMHQSGGSEYTVGPLPFARHLQSMYESSLRLPILDVGCAYGVQAKAALAAGARVIALDACADNIHVMLHEIHTDHPEWLERLWVVVSLIESNQFQLAPESLGGVVFSLVAHFLHPSALVQCLHRMHQWLAPGAPLVLVAISIQHANLRPMWPQLRASTVAAKAEWSKLRQKQQHDVATKVQLALAYPLTFFPHYIGPVEIGAIVESNLPLLFRQLKPGSRRTRKHWV